MASDGPLGFDDSPGDEEPDERPARRHSPDPVDVGRGVQGAPRAQAPARRPGGAGGYGRFVGVVGVLVVVAITLNGFRAERPGSPGVASGAQAPPFAAPLVLSQLDGDVNVALEAGSGEAGNVPACSVRRPDVLNVCALYERGPVVLASFTTRGEECIAQLDRLDDVAARHGQVRFAAIAIRGDREDLRRLVGQRGWRFPVGYDHDGILAGAYGGVVVCPQLTFLRRGGGVQSTSLGAIGLSELETRVRELER